MLNFVKQSVIINIMDKYERKPRGIRFPVSLLIKIEKIMEIKKTDNFSAAVVDLCWDAINKYEIKKDDSKKETNAVSK